MTSAKLLTATGVAIASLCASAQAAISFTFNEVGNDVVIRVTGTLTSAPVGNLNLEYGSFIQPSFPFLQAGPGTVLGYDYWDISSGDGWGFGGLSHYSSAGIDGDYFFFSGGGRLGLRTGNTSIDTTITITGADFTSLGLNLGTYTYTLTGSNGVDTASVAVVVPEPSTYALALGLGVAGVALLRRRASRR